jgi:hypothetical protein
MILTCADGGARAVDLHWKTWTRDRATATGYVAWNACDSSCAAAGAWRKAAADFTLSAAKRVAGRTLFTRLAMHVTGSLPAGYLHHIVFSEAPLAAPVSAAPDRKPAGRSRPSSLSPDASSGTLGAAQIEGFWDLAGGPSSDIDVSGYGTYTRDQVAAAITGAESSFLPGNIQPGEPYSTTGWGLWQITPGDSESVYGEDYQLLDPWNNAEAAVAKYDGAGGFSPWVTYWKGTFKNFLSDVQGVTADTSLTDPGQYVYNISSGSPPAANNSSNPGSTYGPLIPGTVSAPKAPVVTGPTGIVRGTVNLTATDSDSSVSSVKFYVDGVSAGTATKSGSTYTVSWNSAAVPDGPHVVTAVASNSAGSASSAGVTIVTENSPTGSPVLYDPLSGAWEAYATAASGALAETAFDPDSGWSSWGTEGGSITGVPQAIYDPLTGNLEVYATAASGALAQDAWNKSSGWSGWQDLGGSITGSPSVVFDKVTGNLEVYARAASGALAQIAYVPGSGWSSWKSLGGSISGSPQALVDPVTGNLEVYATAASGALAQIAYVPGSGWSSWKSLGGSITGDPAPVYDPVTGNLEVYATAGSGALAQIAYSSKSGWSSWKSLGGSIKGSPSAVYDTDTRNLEVYATAATGAVAEIAYSSGSGWSSWLSLGGSVQGSPVAVNDPVTGNLEVYELAASGALAQDAYAPGSGWSGWNDLGGSLSGL